MMSNGIVLLEALFQALNGRAKSGSCRRVVSLAQKGDSVIVQVQDVPQRTRRGCGGCLDHFDGVWNTVVWVVKWWICQTNKIMRGETCTRCLLQVRIWVGTKTGRKEEIFKVLG